MISNPSIEIQGPAIGEALEPTPSLSLHQLPTPPGDFTGRLKDLTDLVEKVRFNGTHVLGFFGMGGIGKTVLALKLAEELIPRYPDAQFFVDLRGTSRQPLSAHDVMAQVIRAYDPVTPLPAPGAELEGKYRSVLNERRAIIFLDNASDREQIVPLILHEGCILIVTSRHCFALPGLIEKHVDVLPPEEACEFLLTIAPRLENRADEMARLCGCLPLALREAANMLVEHRDLSVDNFVRRMSETHGRRALVTDSVAPSYAALSPELQKMWRLLSVFPGGFDGEDAAAIWNINPAAAQDFLSVLLACSMLQWSDSRSPYRLHDLLRLWALAHCTDEERTWVQKSLAEFGATVMASVNEMYIQGGESLRQGLALFDAKRPNIEEGWGWASSHAEQDERADQLCVRYPVVGRDVLDVRQAPQERIRWLQAPLAAARRLKDKYAETSLLHAAGTAYCHMGEIQHAIEYQMLALTSAREIGDRKLEEQAMRGLGLAYCRKGEYPHALEYHEKALALAREINDRRGVSECLREFAGDHNAMGVSKRAIELGEEAFLLARETGDRCSEAGCLGDLAVAYAAMGDPKRAVDTGSKGLLIARELGILRTEAWIFSILGRSYADLGDVRRALECHEAHLRIARAASDQEGIGDALGNLGNVLVRSGDVRRALECYQELLNIVRAMGDRRGEAMVLGNIGKARARLGETRVAIECHSEQLQIAREIGDRRTEGSALWSTSLALDKLGDRLQAITHAEAARKIFEDSGDGESARVRQQIAEWTAKGSN